MKHFILSVSLMLFAILAFSSKAQAQCEPGYTAITIDVEETDCYQIRVVACYLYDNQNFVLNVEFHHVEFVAKSPECEEETKEAMRRFKENYWESIDEWNKLLVKKLTEDLEIPYIFCNVGRQITVHLISAACTSVNECYVRTEGDETWLRPVFEYVRCDEDATCLSIYEDCWTWNPVTQELELSQTLISRKANIGNTCPGTSYYYPEDSIRGEEPIEIECDVKCQ